MEWGKKKEEKEGKSGIGVLIFLCTQAVLSGE